jgi:methylthioribose-1-phosphate isomerase
MKIAGRHYRTIWPRADGTVEVIDQSRLPFEFTTLALETLEDAARAIQGMVVRGAPLIGATAAYGIALALRLGSRGVSIDEAVRTLQATRPTAHNLAWSLQRMRGALLQLPPAARAEAAYREAALICETDVEQCRCIGVHGLEIIRRAAASSGRWSIS